ncbi:DMT family transporter [Methylobacterium sp. JK268]
MEYAVAMVMSGTIGAFVLESGQSPVNAVFARCIIGTLVISLYIYVTESHKSIAISNRNIILTIVTASSIVANWILLFSSYRYAPIGLVTIIYHVQPLLVFLGGTIFFAERMEAMKGALLGTAFLGVVLIATSNESGSGTIGSGTVQGYALALGAALFYSCATLVGRRLRGVPAPVTTLVQMLLGTVALAPLADFGSPPTTPKQWLCLLTLGVVHSAFMYILIYSAYKKLESWQIAILSFIYPLIALVVDFIYFNREPRAIEIIGSILIIFASLTVSLQRVKGANS